MQEQGGRVTNGAGLGDGDAAAWWPEVATDYQRERWLLPSVRGEKHECYAITEEFAGSDVSDLSATARRDGDDYVLNGVKWHVTSFNVADYVFFQAVLTDRRRTPATTRCFVVDLPTPGRGGRPHTGATRTPSRDEHPIVAFERRAGSGHPPGRAPRATA